MQREIGNIILLTGEEEWGTNIGAATKAQFELMMTLLTEACESLSG